MASSSEAEAAAFLLSLAPAGRHYQSSEDRPKAESKTIETIVSSFTMQKCDGSSVTHATPPPNLEANAPTPRSNFIVEALRKASDFKHEDQVVPNEENISNVPEQDVPNTEDPR